MQPLDDHHRESSRRYGQTKKEYNPLKMVWKSAGHNIWVVPAKGYDDYYSTSYKKNPVSPLQGQWLVFTFEKQYR